jgi:hypothetical protein
MGFVYKRNGCVRSVCRYSTRCAAQQSPRTGKSKQGTLVSFCAVGYYSGSRNRVRGLSLPICEVAKCRILRLFRHRVFRDGHSEFARPSRVHLPAFRHCGIDFLQCELSALSQTKTHSCRINYQLLICGASSDGRRNTCMEFTRWSVEP